MAEKKEVTVVLQKDYVPFGAHDFTQVKAGTKIDLPREEAVGLIDAGLALSEDDALKSQEERDAIKLLTRLGYDVGEPKQARGK